MFYELRKCFKNRVAGNDVNQLLLFFGVDDNVQYQNDEELNE
jgi:hypothetical protein